MTVSIVGWDEQMEWHRNMDNVTVTWSVPGGIVAGCLLVVFGRGGRTYTTANMPSGWTGIGETSPGSGVFASGMWKVADGTETTVAVTFTGSGSSTLYNAQMGVLVAFTKRSYTETPDTSWEIVPSSTITTDDIQFDAVADTSAAEDAIYLAWASYTSGLSNPGYGYDACTDLAFNWDADITQIETDCMYEEYARGESNPALQSSSVKWAAGWTPIVAGTNPATTSTYTDSFPSGGNRFLLRSLEAGLSVLETSYLGFLAEPI